MNAAVYIRKSRENDSKQSYRLTVQREQLPAYARQQGWKITIYDDGHASAARGKAETLPERSRLEQDIRSGRVGIILVIELSRLSRDDTMQDYVAWLTLCADHNVKLATLTRVLDPSQNSDWMLLLMEGGFSSVEMKVLSSRMADGRRQAFISGKFMGGSCPKPYKYDKALGKPVPDKKLQAEMEQIWTMAEKMSAKAIAEALGMAEITIRRAISDDRLLFYQALRTDKETGDTINCDWDPVMSATRAERIRAGRRTRKTNTIRREAAGLLTALGIFRCGYCGKTVKSWNNSKTRADGTRLDYYGCVTKNRKSACPKSKMIAQVTVDQKVLRNIFTTLAKGDKLRTWWVEALAAERDDNQVDDLLGAQKKEEQKKQNLVKAIAEGLIDFEDAKGQMDVIKSNLVSLQNKLDKAAETEPEPDWDGLFITEYEFEHLPFAKQRQVIQALLDSVTLYSTYAIVKYNFPRTKTGSYAARINFAPTGGKKIKTKNRTRL